MPGLPGAAKRLNLLRSPSEVRRVPPDPGMPGDAPADPSERVLPGPMTAWRDLGNGCFCLDLGTILGKEAR